MQPFDAAALKLISFDVFGDTDQCTRGIVRSSVCAHPALSPRVSKPDFELSDIEAMFELVG